MNTEIKFRQLLEIIKQKNPGALEALGEGLTRNEIQNLIKIHPVPEELIAIYTCVEGLSLRGEYDAIVPAFLPGWDLMNIHGVNDEIDILASVNDSSDVYKPDMIPFLCSGRGDHLCIRSLPNDHSIWFVVHDDDDSGIVHKNMDDFIITAIQCFEEEAYYFDEDEGYWASDFDTIWAIGEELNPEIDFMPYS